MIPGIIEKKVLDFDRGTEENPEKPQGVRRRIQTNLKVASFAIEIRTRYLAKRYHLSQLAV